MSELVDRRKFLVRAIKWIGGGIVASLGVPAVAYVVGPATRPERAQVVSLGAGSRVEPGTPALLKATVERTAGYLTVQEEVGVFVKTEDSREFVALSNICTHLGCRVRWVDESRQFYCPCHAGVFDEDGDVVSGPPPRPLDRYPITVEQGELLLHLDETAGQ